MAKKRTPVTSVTPKSTVKPVSKAQQARTRKLIAGIASVTPVGRAAKAVDKGVANLINIKTNKMMHFGGGTTKEAIKARRDANKLERYYATAKPTRGYKDNPNPPKKVVIKKKSK